jgi:hypothetical protein
MLFKMLVGEPERERRVGRSRRKREANIKMSIREVSQCMDRRWDFINMAMNLKVS